MKLLTFTSLFPNNTEQNKGIFIKQRISALAKLCEIKVIAPVAWFPGKSLVSRYFKKIKMLEKQDDLVVYHPKYFYTPKIFRSLYGIFYFLSLYLFVKRIRKKFDFDIIDAHWAYPDGLAAVLIAKLLRKKVSISLRGSDINRFPKSFLLRSQIRFALNNADLVISVSRFLGEDAKRIGVKKNIIIIPNGADPKLFKQRDKNKARNKLNLPKDKQIILAIGGLIKRKGFNYLIEAIQHILEQRKDILLLIIGKGGVEGNETDNLKKQIKIMGLKNYVNLLLQKPHKELPWWINSCDVFCLPSLREGYPNVLVEALACGKPVIATNAYGAREIVKDKKYGFLVKRKDVPELASALTNAMNKKWNAKEISRYGRSNSWQDVAKKIESEFRRILE